MPLLKAIQLIKKGVAEAKPTPFKIAQENKNAENKSPNRHDNRKYPENTRKICSLPEKVKFMNSFCPD